MRNHSEVNPAVRARNENRSTPAEHRSVERCRIQLERSSRVQRAGKVPFRLEGSQDLVERGFRGIESGRFAPDGEAW